MDAAEDDASLLDLLRETLREQCASPAMHDAVLRPLLKWFLRSLIPYLALFVGIHFFTTVGALSLVLLWLKK